MSRTILMLLGIVALTFAVVVTPAGAEQGKASKSTAATKVRVDINTASAEELAQLPGIGDKVAARVVTYREENGRFLKIEEIMNVRGIGEKTFLKIKDSLIVQSSSKKKGSSRKKS